MLKVFDVMDCLSLYIGAVFNITSTSDMYMSGTVGSAFVNQGTFIVNLSPVSPLIL